MTTHIYTLNSGAEEWTDTGINIVAGQLLVICADGRWSPVTRIGYCEPTGFDKDYVPITYPADGIGEFSGDNYFNTAQIGIGNTQAPPWPLTHTDAWSALAGFIGTPVTDEPPSPGSYGFDTESASTKGPRIFYIGSNYEELAPETGRLYIRSSDDAYTSTLDDNGGSITVHITVDGTPRDCSPITPECGDIFIVSTIVNFLQVQVWRGSSLIRVIQGPGNDVATQGWGCAFDGDLNFYTTLSNDSVMKLDFATGLFSTVWGGSGGDAVALDIDNSNLIYVLSSTGTLRIMSTSGTVYSTHVMGAPTGTVVGCAVTRDGSVVAYSDSDSTARRVRRWEVGPQIQGTDLLTASTSDHPRGLVYDTNNDLWVATQQGVLSSATTLDALYKFEAVTDIRTAYNNTAGNNTVVDVALDHLLNKLVVVHNDPNGVFEGFSQAGGFFTQPTNPDGIGENLEATCLAVMCSREGPLEPAVFRCGDYYEAYNLQGTYPGMRVDVYRDGARLGKLINTSFSEQPINQAVFDSQGNFYIATSSRLIKLFSNSNTMVEIAAPAAVTIIGLSIDQDDILWVVDFTSGGVSQYRRYDTSGTQLSVVTIGNVGDDSGCAIKWDGSVFAYLGNKFSTPGRIRRWNVGPATQGTDLTPTKGPWSAVYDPTNDDLYVAVTESGLAAARLDKITDAGVVTSYIYTGIGSNAGASPFTSLCKDYYIGAFLFTVSNVSGPTVDSLEAVRFVKSSTTMTKIFDRLVTGVGTTIRAIAVRCPWAVTNPGPVLETSTVATKKFGSAIWDSVEISGLIGIGTGTITFRLYGPGDEDCTDDPIFTDIVNVGENGIYISSSYTPTFPGTYTWVAEYNGNVDNPAVIGDCGDENETITLRQSRIAQATLIGAT